jgi:primase-polymerase (primpol)-like protein
MEALSMTTTQHDDNTKPTALQVVPANIPEELRERDQWVTWRWWWDAKRDKWTKPPLTVLGYNASSTNPQTWATFQAVIEAYQTGRFDGIGYVLAPTDSYVGIDLDHCVDPDTGEIESWARGIFNEMDSYTERSPSGTGLRILVRGKLPGTGHKKGNIEIYDRARYVTITGQIVQEASLAN